MTKTNEQPTASTTDEAVNDQTNPLDILVEEEPAIGEIIKKSPEVEQVFREHPELSGQILQVTKHFSGPLPPPELLAGYDQICPGAAQDIINMAKDDAEHIRYMQKASLRSHNTETVLGIVSGFFIALFAIGGLTFAAVSGQPITAGVVASLAVLAGVFMKKKVKRPDNKDA